MADVNALNQEFPIPVDEGGTGATTASGARTNLGLGTMATQNANSVAITGGGINGVLLGTITPVPLGSIDVLLTEAMSFRDGSDLLTDYATATAFTLTPFGSLTVGSPTGTFQGKYIKLGRDYFVVIELTFTSLGGMAGDLIVTGLPGNVATAPASSGLSISRRGNFQNQFPILAQTVPGANRIYFYNGEVDDVRVSVDDLTDTTFIYFSGFYLGA